MDEEPTRTPQYLQYFDVTDAGFAWREPRADEIVRRRADMNDKFIFDILLASGGIEQPEVLYPPRNVEDLKALLSPIEDSTYDTLKKDCLVYYLLKWHQDGREERLQVERCIPPQFTALADAYWHLDTGINVPRAVALLSDNRLNREFVSKILHALSISPNPSPLIVQYVRTAKPLLTTPQDVWTYMLALAESSFLEAWRFQRTFNETVELRKQLLEKLLEWCITPEPRPQGLSALLCFPLSPFEEQFLHNYALQPPKSLSRPSIAILRDLICVRLIQSGKYTDAVKVDHQFASSTLNESKSSSQDRRKMVQDLYAALPQAERTLLDSELETLTQAQQTAPTINGIPPKPSVTASAAPAADVSMSQRWEDIPRPLPSQTLASGRPTPAASPFRDTHPPVIPLPERAGAPRFGGPIPGTSTSTTAAAAAAPILPISQPTTAIPTSQTFPLSTTTTARSRTSFGPPPAQFFPGASTGATHTTQFPASQPSFGFTSASRKPNAFYKPPPAKQPQGVKRPFDIVLSEERPPGARDMDVDAGNVATEEEEEEEEHLHMDVEPERGAGRRMDEDQRSDVAVTSVRDDFERAGNLAFSVFGNGPGPVQAQQTKPRGATKTRGSRGAAAAAAPSVSVAPPPKRASRRVPPGAFMSDEEDGEEDEPPAAPAPIPANTRTRTSVRQTNKSSSRAPEPPRNKRARRVREEELGRSLPGSLMDEEENDDQEDENEDQDEEADYVAPLRQPSPPLPTRRAVRAGKARSTTPASDMGDEDGQTRRRSSRLSTVSAGGAGLERPPKKSAGNASANVKGKKSARATGAAGTTKKRR